MENEEPLLNIVRRSFKAAPEQTLKELRTLTRETRELRWAIWARELSRELQQKRPGITKAEPRRRQ